MKVKSCTYVVTELELSISLSIRKKSVDAIAYIHTTYGGQVSGISYGNGLWMGSAFFDERLGKTQADKVRKSCVEAYESAISCTGIPDYRIKKAPM